MSFVHFTCSRIIFGRENRTSVRCISDAPLNTGYRIFIRVSASSNRIANETAHACCRDKNGISFTLWPRSGFPADVNCARRTCKVLIVTGGNVRDENGKFAWAGSFAESGHERQIKRRRRRIVKAPVINTNAVIAEIRRRTRGVVFPGKHGRGRKYLLHIQRFQ